MSEKPPRHPRDMGGSFTINNPEDGSSIRMMLPLGERLLAITDNCVYSTQLADQIDPGRTNDALAPIAQQLIFTHGYRSPLLRRTLLQAHAMFRDGFQKIDNGASMLLAFEATTYLMAMETHYEQFSTKEQAAIGKVDGLDRKDRSLVLPPATNPKETCKAFCQDALHYSDTLLKIVRQFEPEMKKQGWDEYLAMVRKRFGADDPFTKSLETAVPFLQRLKDSRDCLDHQLPGATVEDFKANPDGTISRPSISLNIRKTKLPSTDVTTFMRQSIEDAIDVFQMTVLHLCAKHVQPFAGLKIIVDRLPPPYDATAPARFGYGSLDGAGNFVPIG